MKVFKCLVIYNLTKIRNNRSMVQELLLIPSQPAIQERERLERKPPGAEAVHIGTEDSAYPDAVMAQPTRGSVVAIIVEGFAPMLGTTGEKVAGGLFEVELVVDGATVSGVFRLDELRFPLAVVPDLTTGSGGFAFGFSPAPNCRVTE